MDSHEENAAIEGMAANTILQRGVKVKIPAPWFIRWFKRTVSLTLSSPYQGTLFRVSRYYLSTGLKDSKLEDITVEEAQVLMAVHGRALTRAVACAILNGYVKGKLFTRPLAWYLRWNLKPQQLFALTTALLLYGGTADFMNTTRSVRRMKMTKPNLGQMTEGS